MQQQQQQQQQQGGGSQSQYRLSTEIPHFAAPRTGQMPTVTTATTTDNINNNNNNAYHQQAEEASPISSRPPASSNFEELLVPVGHGSGGGNGGDDDVLGASDEMDRGGISGGNRWPRQETLALLKIRSEMDVTFRDASLKGPLWEEVSRKLAELGYTRSAKKCKEKFENVHKYYKRTKEGRAGRQDGKSYRFFSQLEALHGTTTTATPTSTYVSPPAPAAAAAATTTTNPLFVNPVSIGISNPMPVQIPPPSSSQIQAHQIMGGASQIGIISPPLISTTAATMTAATTSTPAVGPSLGINFSSDSYSTSSSASEDEEDDEDDVDLPVELGGSSSKYVPDSSIGRGQKRKRGGGGSVGGSGSRRLMGFLESLMRQVMQKQEAMQQKFLETIEKREKDRMIREEAWKRQEMTRLSREHELMAQERAIAASRDSAIISFLQKITGQTIQFPTTTPITTTFTVPIATPPPLPTPSATIQPPPPPPPQQQQSHHQQRQQTRHQLHQAQKAEEVTRHQQPPSLPPPPVSSEIVMAVPEQQVAPVVQQETSGGGGGGSGSYDPASSRWPKTEVNVLIQLRSEFEAKYQEAGPKGPLWEEISSRMQRMGYKRNAKRCKEKWENINKYFKKVKESNKKRPEDAKTCPYFHQLDALYRKKSLTGSTSGAGSTSFGNQNLPEQPQQQQQQQQNIALDPTITAAPPQILTAQATESASGNKVDNSTDLQTTLFREGSSSAGGGPVKPEDIVKELIEQQQQQQQQQRKPSMMDDYDKVEELDSDNLDLDEDDEEEEEESEEDTKMAYKIEFQRQNNAGGSASNRGGNGGAPSFVTMVQ